LRLKEVEKVEMALQMEVEAEVKSLLGNGVTEDAMFQPVADKEVVLQIQPMEEVEQRVDAAMVQMVQE
jgi:hypothetical protein